MDFCLIKMTVQDFSLLIDIVNKYAEGFAEINQIIKQQEEDLNVVCINNLDFKQSLLLEDGALSSRLQRDFNLNFQDFNFMLVNKIGEAYVPIIDMGVETPEVKVEMDEKKRFMA